MNVTLRKLIRDKFGLLSQMKNGTIIDFGCMDVEDIHPIGGHYKNNLCYTSWDHEGIRLSGWDRKSLKNLKEAPGERAAQARKEMKKLGKEVLKEYKKGVKREGVICACNKPLTIDQLHQNQISANYGKDYD